ncbi:MAG: alpha/beta hydrolase [Gemmatimonadota bacterium]|nr:alpha/beta hydrolase [Gemmatimonadota bacterium]
MRERRRRALPAALILAVGCSGCGERDAADSNPAAEAAPGVPALQSGSGQFTFHDARGNADRPITVRYHMPDGYTPETPIVFVMHGASRTGQRYFDDWEEHAIAHGFLLVVPEFDADNYPGSQWYNLGNVFPDPDAETTPNADRPADAGADQAAAGSATRNPESAWSFAAIEHLFDAVRAATGSTRTTFRIFGHSAGSQFVHRLLMTRPDAPVERAVAANAGWYTMPDESVAWPYGLGDSGFDAAGLAGFLQLPVTVLLGDADTVTTAGNLRRTPEAMLQGPHRFTRGHTFYAAAQSAAEALGVDFGWALDTVPGAGHSNALMAPRAAEILAR